MQTFLKLVSICLLITINLHPSFLKKRYNILHYIYKQKKKKQKKKQNVQKTKLNDIFVTCVFIGQKQVIIFHVDQHLGLLMKKKQIQLKHIYVMIQVNDKNLNDKRYITTIFCIFEQ